MGPLFAVLILASPAIEQRTVTGHALQYLVSLPQGWTAAKQWPAVVVIDSARREPREAIAEFIAARGEAPWILISPFVVTNGGARFREVPTYPYAAAAWAEVDRQGQFAFDEAGIAAMLADARKQFAAEERAWITGWEAAGHTIFALLFQHPDWFRGAAIATPNYAGRWLDGARFSTWPGRTSLPVRILIADDKLVAVLAPQIDRAIATARQHGFANVSTERVPKPHGSLAPEVLKFFATIR